MASVIAARNSRRKLALLALLLLLLALAAYLVYYFTLNKSLPLTAPELAAGDVITPPQYLYSVAGAGKNALGRPVGVAISPDGRLFVSDVSRTQISVFTLDGKFLFAFDKIADGKNKQLKSPVHMAFDGKGELYVTDRILDAVYVFDATGKYVRKFDPGVPALEKTWSPLAVAFGPDQKLYLSDVGDTNKHQMLAFSPAGEKVLQWGKTAQVTQAGEAPSSFYFPNGIGVTKSGLIFVADGNNRRLQVFDATGKFVQFIASSGIPRGVSVDEKNQRVIVTDALAHQIDIYSYKGEKLVSFGEGGTAGGQFQYPNDVTLDADGRIFIADRENHQVQVWGWPQAQLPVSVASIAQRWYWCLTPLLLLPLLLMLRRRQFVVAPDFVDALAMREDVDLMEHRRLRWLAPEADHAQHYAGRVESGVDLGELIEGVPHSDSDVQDIVRRIRVDEPTAVLLSVAQRSGRFCTEDPELHKLALLLDIEVFDCEAFSERYPRKQK